MERKLITLDILNSTVLNVAMVVNYITNAINMLPW